MAVWVFDLFKIGIGPSSSHTVGPMRAARLFVQRLQAQGQLLQVGRVECLLYGSLAATGKGHGSDKAVLLGLMGQEPDRVDVDRVPALLQAVAEAGRLRLHDATGPEIAFDAARDLTLFRRETLPFHANGMRFAAFDAAGAVLAERTFYSVGGGFVVSHELADDGSRHRRLGAAATPQGLGRLELRARVGDHRRGPGLPALPPQHAAARALGSAGGGLAEPGPRDRPGHRDR